jgi:hypothetical protein
MPDSCRTAKPKSGVGVTLIGDSNFETIIVTQTCLPSKLQWPKALNGRLPVATKGGLEECVHKWLESKGNAISLLLFSFVPYSSDVSRYQ